MSRTGVSPETIITLRRGGVLSLSSRFYLGLWRVLTWRRPRCVNCADSDRARLERHPSGLWACTSCASRWKYRNAPLGEEASDGPQGG